MKILVVAESINIEDSSGSKANVAFIHNLVKADFEVLVYHYTLRDIKLKNVNTYAIPEIKISVNYFLSRLQRIISRKFKINFAPFLERLFGFSFTFFNDTSSIKKALEKSKFEPDLIVTLSKGASFRPHYAVLKLPELHNIWMAYVHDPYPFHFYPRPYTWVESNYKQKEIFFANVCDKAKYSVFPSQLLLEWMGSFYPNFLKTGIVIPHQSSKYKIKNSDFPDYFDPSKFNLLHAGNLMKARSPEGLIKGLQLFFNKNKEAQEHTRLLLLGPSSDFSKILEEYKKSIPQLIINNKNIPFDEIYNIQKNVSVNIIIESKSEISPFLPAKFSHCVEANKPILSLAPFYSETKRLLGVNYDYWSEADDENKIAAILEKLYNLWKQNSNDLLLNRNDLEQYLSADYLREIIVSLNKKTTVI